MLAAGTSKLLIDSVVHGVPLTCVPLPGLGVVLLVEIVPPQHC